MAVQSTHLTTGGGGIRQRWRKMQALFANVPILGWLLGCLVAAILEQYVGLALAQMLGMAKIPALFGFLFMLKTPILIPSAITYNLLIYILPITLVAKLSAPVANKVAGKLIDTSVLLSVLIHIVLLYAVLHIWTDISEYRLLVTRLTLIAIIITLSLNVINGYMGEFSCSHPGFIALGAYGSSVFTVLLFTDDNFFGPALLPPALGPFMFPIALIVGGIVASLSALVVAIPSFRTRGDYLAIISLAFLFIVKSLLENLEMVGGPRGLGSQPNWASLPVVFTWMILSIWIINNFVRSTMGKALNAVRDDETAADAMTVNTRRTKMTAFLFAAFWAGVAGGLLAHVLRYINPSSFGLQRLAEVLAMVYFGGLNSVAGSIVGAVSMNLLSEALRPLQIFKWIVIPVLLILVMIYRPTGLISFREFDVAKMLQPKQGSQEGVDHASASS